MIDYTVNYWSGFYHIMQCCRMTEVCWNNNKANVFPVQTDTPLMGCQTNFLLSESCRQPNRCSDHDSSLLWALRGNIHIPNYHPLRPMIIYRHKKKKSQICFTVRKNVFHRLHVPTHVQSWSEPASEGHLWKHLINSAWLCFLFCCLLTQMWELCGDAVCAWLG